MIFTDHPLYHIYSVLKRELKGTEQNGTVSFEVIDPDVSNEFSGTLISISGEKYIYRPFKVWVDLAEILHCRIMTPFRTEKNRVLIKYKPLNLQKSWHNNSGVNITERYGEGSDFSKIFKFEEPYFLNDYLRAINEVSVGDGMKVLNIGINRGDEFRIFSETFPEVSKNIFFTGIDHCGSALKAAAKNLPDSNFRFIKEDIRKIESLELPQQDIIISVGTLQSPEIDGKEIFRYIIQNIIKPDGSVILGFPNSRYIDCEVVYGAKTKNYTESNLNLLIKDISFYKKYLQQHGYKVITFGKYYVFLVGIKNTSKAEYSLC
jgi:trans-aconitate methyltransferase